MGNAQLNEENTHEAQQYVYTLTCRVDGECDRTVGDYIMADCAKDAYEAATSVCEDLNKKYGTAYSVQSVMPNMPN